MDIHQVGKKLLRSLRFLLSYTTRSYDRHHGIPPADPYYAGGVAPGPPPMVDPYHNYDPYQKYYGNRSRDAEYPSPRFVVHISYFFKIDDCLCFSSDYDNYPNYRHESYGASNGSQGMRRHELPVDLPPSHESYPPSRRQHPSYSSGPSNPAPYYGIPPR